MRLTSKKKIIIALNYNVYYYFYKINFLFIMNENFNRRNTLSR